MPMPVPFGSVFLPQPAFSATAFRTPAMRALLKPTCSPNGPFFTSGVFGGPRRSIWNCRGSLPRRMRQLVEERLVREGNGVALGRAHQGPSECRAASSSSRSRRSPHSPAETPVAFRLPEPAIFPLFE